jgi:ketosteroid isomerase-like protein
VTSANLDLVRSICDAWARGDWSSVEWADPGIEFVAADGLVSRTWKGLRGMSEGWRDFLTAWKEIRFEPEDYRELDGGRVLVLNHFSGRGRTSGLDVGRVGVDAACVFHIRDGKVTRLAAYMDRALALAELGQPAGDLPPDDARHR